MAIEIKFLDHYIILKNHTTENFWPQGHLTETPFDRTPFDRMPFDRQFIRPNRRLTESSFYRKVTWPIFFRKWPNTESNFEKNDIWAKKMGTRSFDPKFIWPKPFSENDHLTERSFDRKFIWPNEFFEKWSFDRKVI
jgi:hypothetical protein